MNISHESTEYPLLRTERQRRALRNAIARRKLEQMREERRLNLFITEVWNEPDSAHGTSS